MRTDQADLLKKKKKSQKGGAFTLIFGKNRFFEIKFQQSISRPFIEVSIPV